MIKAVRIHDGQVPKNIGEWSFQPKMFRPPYGEREEIFVVTPHNHTGALIPENHKWTIDADDKITVTPSIVYFDYHGFLVNGEWS